jgi:hypothetical protein
LPKYTISLRDKPSEADVRRAETSAECLSTAIWVTPAEARLEPGPGFSTLNVSETTLGEMEHALLSDLAAFNANHPINPVHLQVK